MFAAEGGERRCGNRSQLHACHALCKASTRQLDDAVLMPAASNMVAVVLFLGSAKQLISFTLLSGFMCYVWCSLQWYVCFIHVAEASDANESSTLIIQAYAASFLCNIKLA